MNNIEKLAYSTVRIQAFNENGQSHFGTGFLFGFNLKGCSDRDLVKPVLVTNKHVLLGFDKISLRFNISNVYGKPILGSFEEFVVSNVEEGSLFHPDPKVDLAVIPLLEFMSQHENLYCQFLRESNIPTEFELKKVFATDEIVMVGYPCGIADEENNLPVFRKGILSTFPSVDYNGEKKFLIDAACFPGSSGSPVLLYDKTPYLENSNQKFNSIREYPAVKCTALNGRKVYYLPFDGDFDSIHVGVYRGGCYKFSVLEAEQAGFHYYKGFPLADEEYWKDEKNYLPVCFHSGYWEYVELKSCKIIYQNAHECSFSAKFVGVMNNTPPKVIRTGKTIFRQRKSNNNLPEFYDDKEKIWVTLTKSRRMLQSECMVEYHNTVRPFQNNMFRIVYRQLFKCEYIDPR